MPIRQFVTFDVDHQFYGIPVGVVQEILLNEVYTPMPLAPPSFGGLFNLRGEVIGTVDLRARFGLTPRPVSGPVVNVVVRTTGETVSLLVDRIGMVVDLNDDALEAAPAGPGQAPIVGTYPCDGRLLQVLDAERCVTTAGPEVPQG